MFTKPDIPVMFCLKHTLANAKTLLLPWACRPTCYLLSARPGKTTIDLGNQVAHSSLGPRGGRPACRQASLRGFLTVVAEIVWLCKPAVSAAAWVAALRLEGNMLDVGTHFLKRL